MQQTIFPKKGGLDPPPMYLFNNNKKYYKEQRKLMKFIQRHLNKRIYNIQVYI